MDKQDTSWEASRSIQAFPKLEKNIETDVVIVGGGMAGLLSAYVLAKAGKKVIVLEKGRLASGVTLKTTAFLTQIIDTDAEDVCRMLGVKKAKIMYASHMSGSALIERIAREEKIDCDFKRVSNYIIAKTKDETEGLEDEVDVLKALGLAVVFERNKSGNIKNTAVLEVKDQAKFNPLSFLSGLVPVLISLGVSIYENTEVESLNTEDQTAGNSVAGGLVIAKAGEHGVRAKWSVTATYQPFNNPAGVFMKKGMYVSYVYEIEVPKGSYAEGTYEDMKNPYHYFRVDAASGGAGDSQHDRIIVGGEDHRIEIPMDKEKNWQALSDYCDKTFGKDTYKIIRRWDGPMLEPSDGFALIGILKKNQIVATAFSGNGMTYSGIAAIMIRDIIEKGKSDWDTLYNPKRFPTFTMLRIKIRDYTGEFLRGALRNMIKYSKIVKEIVKEKNRKRKEKKQAK
ncbi:MAG TPA: FAD-binding oxidoreductase [Candidatus Paceibacterota bacterium]|nr:FAD-binding oxidoreductase [Candidatus Paceibacterota bacterium]